MSQQSNFYIQVSATGQGPKRHQQDGQKDVARKQRKHEENQINKQEQRRMRLEVSDPRAVATQPDTESRERRLGEAGGGSA